MKFWKDKSFYLFGEEIGKILEELIVGKPLKMQVSSQNFKVDVVLQIFEGLLLGFGE